MTTGGGGGSNYSTEGQRYLLAKMLKNEEEYISRINSKLRKNEKNIENIVRKNQGPSDAENSVGDSVEEDRAGGRYGRREINVRAECFSNRGSSWASNSSDFYNYQAMRRKQIEDALREEDAQIEATEALEFSNRCEALTKEHMRITAKNRSKRQAKKARKLNKQQALAAENRPETSCLLECSEPHKQTRDVDKAGTPEDLDALAVEFENSFC